MKKKILGLDLGTNSIGWALVEQDFDNETGKILGMGSRIIPMGADIIGDFGKGNSVSQTAERTFYRSVRRLRERNLLRRERLHRVLNVLGFLPIHYANDIDFEKHFGQFKQGKEPKLAWIKNKNNKFEFIFPELFNEMLAEFKKAQPDLFNRINLKGENVKIPYDWTIYYLRKKALEEKITKEQLAWLILNFNQKRGYYQLRGEDEEDTNDNKKEYVISLKIINVVKGEPDKKNNNKIWYSITFDNGWQHSFPFTSEPNWLNTEREFIVTEEYENGKIKILKDKKKDSVGREKRSLSILPSFEEINLLSKKEQDKIYKKIKARTELTISESKKTVGSYIYKTLLRTPNQKIRGKLIRTIERKYYRDELKAILEKQITLQPELFTADLYNACVRELYRSNKAHQIQLSKRDFVHLFLDDIIFYQRPLRSQKSSIGNCTLEFRSYKQKDDHGNEIKIKEYLKVIPKSNPYYQEFRVWQWLFNLKIYTRNDDIDVTETFLKTIEEKEKLFEFLMSKKEVNHSDILTFLLAPIIKDKYPAAKPKAFKDALIKEISKYRWNYVFDESQEKEDEKSKKYPMNETGYEIRKRLFKVENAPDDFLDIVDVKEIVDKKTTKKTTIELGTREYQLWHLIYSVNDPKEFEKALKAFAHKYQLNVTSFVEQFIKFPPFKSDFGTYSEKAIKKLLPLMRLGKYWNENKIIKDSSIYFKNIHQLIDKLQKKSDAITSNQKENWGKSINEKLYNELYRFLDADIANFQGLQLYLAQYLIYGRHSEAAETKQWSSVKDLEMFLKSFKQHSLRNPIVEQVITESLRVIKDIWTSYGNNSDNFFNEIHVELGREMKNTADDRATITKQISENENTNQRIKLLLTELRNDLTTENVREFSPSQMEILKIYEEGVLNLMKNKEYSEGEMAQKEEDEKMLKISTTAQPSKSDLTRYKLWLEQKYRSPYTGEIIPLSKLFTPDYEIEHIIPQSRYFDDSLSNKVICESVVNKNPYKDNQLGLEFIKAQGGRIVNELSSNGKIVKIFTESEYRDYVNEYYAKNNTKRNKLLMDEIPDKMIARQMNDTRYISKYISHILSNIVRDENNDDGINSKNVIPGNGRITDSLKQDWGLNNVWNQLILPRFERMNQLTNSKSFTTTNKEGHTIPTIPLEYSKGFQKKRIDHRHHAMDALVVACMTRDHVNLINNQFAKSENTRYDLQNKLRIKEKWVDNTGKARDKFTSFKKPWDNFAKDAKTELEKIIVSFKQNLRVINKATNSYEKIDNGKKVEVKQKGTNWAIRKPLHKETVSGKVELPRIKTPKGKILTATRKAINTSFDLRTIESITDLGIQEILKNYLASKNNNPEVAFSPEGIEEMNKNIAKYNNGKFHQPINKVRIFEVGSKFPLGQTGNKAKKFVEAAKGTNLFFGVYTDESGKRSYSSIPLNEVIERQKQGLNPVPEFNEEGHSLLFHLSPNDLVYVPEEKESASQVNFGENEIKNFNNLFKIVSFTGSRLSAIPVNVASTIVNKIEYTQLNKIELTKEKESMIKIYCDRLGYISLIQKGNYLNTKQGEKVSEPNSVYEKKKWTLKIFNSFEEVENDQLTYFASLTPEELLNNLKKLTKSAFGISDEQSLNNPDRKIKFR